MIRSVRPRVQTVFVAHGVIPVVTFINIVRNRFAAVWATIAKLVKRCCSFGTSISLGKFCCYLLLLGQSSLTRQTTNWGCYLMWAHWLLEPGCQVTPTWRGFMACFHAILEQRIWETDILTCRCRWSSLLCNPRCGPVFAWCLLTTARGHAQDLLSDNLDVHHQSWP